jgi:hypothetical protein
MRTGASSLSRKAMSACSISAGTFQEKRTRPSCSGSMRTTWRSMLAEASAWTEMASRPSSRA